jgi:DNA-binding NarL/FixJ family response regulator
MTVTITAAAISASVSATPPPAPHLDVRPADLSSREQDVLRLIASGMSNLEIASSLYLSINSVKTYIRAAYRKIGVERRSQAVVWAVQHGLLDIPGVTVVLDDPTAATGAQRDEASAWLASA